MDNAERTAQETKELISPRKNFFGAIEGTRTPTPLPVHGPEPCASANSATMAIWTCNAAAAVRPPCQEDQPYLFYSPVTGCQTTTSPCSRTTWQPFSAQRGARAVASPRSPKPEARSPYPSFAVIEIFAFRTFDTGQPFSAAS